MNNSIKLPPLQDEKICKYCGVTKPVDQFNAQRSKCKDCRRKYHAEWYQKNFESQRLKYENYRKSNLENIRIKARERLKNSQKERDRLSALRDLYAKNNPIRMRVKHVLQAAVRRGNIKPLPCLICGGNAEAHHPDYSSPLDVVWLCVFHHRQAHAILRRKEFRT